MDVLAVARHLPYSGVPHAGGEYLLRHLHELSAQGRTTVLVPDEGDVLPHLSSVPSWLDVVVAPPADPRRGSARWQLDRAYRRLHPAPMPDPASLRGVVAAGLTDLARAADVVELHWAEYARFAPVLRRAGVRTPVVVVEHDVESESFTRRLRAYARGSERVVGEVMRPVHARRERRGLAAADLVLVFKQADADLLRRGGLRTPVQVVEPWVEHPPALPDDRDPHRVLFTGAMWRQENDEAALWFLDRVWPAVRAVVPTASLVVAGSGPSARLQDAAAAAGGVEVTGEVPDLLPEYLRASVFVAPLLVGAGLKFKVAQAMACGLPVLATRVGAEGIAGSAPPDVLWAVTDDEAEWRVRLRAALEEPSAAALTGRRAAAWARQTWSFATSTRRLVEDYAALC